MYRTIIKPAGVNPLTGKKQYSVYDSHSIVRFSIDPLIRIGRTVILSGINIKQNWYAGKVIVLITDKRYQVGTFINPRRALGI